MGDLFRKIISTSLLTVCYGMSSLFYKIKVRWIHETGEPQWPHPTELRLFLLINHTSLFEPILCIALPFPYFLKLGRKFIVPGADKTLNRPLVGWFWKFITPNMVKITRKRDESWDRFKDVAKKGGIIALTPEGRMLRPNGLDATGKPMSIRGGVADILEFLDEGKILIAYSGGLHHVQAPGNMRVRLFQELKVNLETLDIKAYKAQFQGVENFRGAVIQDLTERKKKNTPQ